MKTADVAENDVYLDKLKSRRKRSTERYIKSGSCYIPCNRYGVIMVVHVEGEVVGIARWEEMTILKCYERTLCMYRCASASCLQTTFYFREQWYTEKRWRKLPVLFLIVLQLYIYLTGRPKIFCEKNEKCVISKYRRMNAKVILILNK